MAAIFWLTLMLTGLILLVIITEYVIPYVIKRIMIKCLKDKCKGKVVLTYDDGPGPHLEAKLLQLLNQYNVNAAFFLHGMRAQSSPGQCDILWNSGQEIGCHGYNHMNAYKSAPWKVLSDVKKSFHVLEKWINRDKFFRPPHGKLTLSMLLFFKMKNFRTIFWTIDSGDTNSVLPDPDSIIQKVIQNNGAVILMHSFDRESVDKIERAEYVVSLTHSLLEIAKKKNLKVCTISEIFN